MEENKLINKETEKDLINEPDNPMSDNEEVEEGGSNPQQPQPQQPIEPMPTTEFIRIGDLQLSSSILNAHELTSIALGILKEDFVKDYLENVKQRRLGLGGSMFG